MSPPSYPTREHPHKKHLEEIQCQLTVLPTLGMLSVVAGATGHRALGFPSDCLKIFRKGLCDTQRQEDRAIPGGQVCAHPATPTPSVCLPSLWFTRKTTFIHFLMLGRKSSELIKNKWVKKTEEK